METAMQQLKEFLNQWTSMDGQRLVCTVKYLTETVDNLLEEEKKQIMEAATCGYFEAREGQHDPDCYGVEYFATTYEKH